MVWYNNKYRANVPPVRYYDFTSKEYVNALYFGNQDGILLVYMAPSPDHEYVISVDVAEGLEHGDYSVILVLNMRTLDIDAVYHARTDEVQLADYVYRTAEMFTPKGAASHPPVVAIETNGPGLATFDRAEMLGVENLFMMPRFDSSNNTTTFKKGWRTDSFSKQTLVASVREYLDARLGELRYMPIIRECMTFVRNKNGKPGAKEGCNDDLVVALGIALEVAQICPPVKRRSATTGPTQLNDIFAKSIDIPKKIPEPSLQERCFQHALEHRKDVDSPFDDLVY